MKYPAASNGVSTGIRIIAPRGGELNLHPPPADEHWLALVYFIAGH